MASSRRNQSNRNNKKYQSGKTQYSEGYDVEIIDNKFDSENQVCIICNLLMRQPVQGIPLVEGADPCGHRFCKGCLERWHKECK